MPISGRFNEWGCDGPGSSEDVRILLYIDIY
jgi:hypothetical protein